MSRKNKTQTEIEPTPFIDVGSSILPDITEEEEKKIMSFGAFGENAHEMRVILGWDDDIFWAHYDNEDGRFHQLLEEGKIKYEYTVKCVLFNDFKDNGNIRAFEALEKLRQQKYDEDE